MILRRALPLLMVLAASAASAQPADVAVNSVWARATAGPSKTAAVYATITASEPDRLTGVSTPVASMAEVHQSQMRNGMMEMRAVPGGVPLTPGAPLRLSPGGYHIMLTGLKHPLMRGEKVPLTLTFEHAGPVTVEAAVEAAGATGADMAAMPGMTAK